MMAVSPKQLNDAQVINLDRVIEAGRKAEVKARMQARYLEAAKGGDGDLRRWYVLRIAHRAEHAVVSDLDGYGLTAWAPVKTVWRTVFHSRKKRATTRPIFRSYVFVQAVTSPEAWVGLLGIKGVASILGSENGPIPIGDETMCNLMDLVKEGAFDEKKGARPYERGETVRIKDGPFADFSSVIDGYVRSRAVRVLAQLFGREVPIELTLAQIEKC